VSEIRDLNPSLLRSTAPLGYEVRVPKTKGSMVLAALESVPEEKRCAWRLHRISEGETLAAISRRYSTPAGSIVAANSRLGSSFFDSPERGEMLLIPAAAKPEPAVKAARTKKGSAGRKYAGSKRRPAPKVATLSGKPKTQRASNR